MDRGECRCVLKHIAKEGLKLRTLPYELARGSASEKFICRGRIKCYALRSLGSHDFMKCDSPNQGGWRNPNAKHMSQKDTMGKQTAITRPSAAGGAAGRRFGGLRSAASRAAPRSSPRGRAAGPSQREQNHCSVRSSEHDGFPLRRTNAGKPTRNPGGTGSAGLCFHGKQLRRR